MKETADVVPSLHFVLSAPRSGSTWLVQALNQHHEIHATEHRLFGEFAEVWRNNDGGSAPRITLDSYARAMSGPYFHDELNMTAEQFVDEFIQLTIGGLLGMAGRRSGAKVVIDKVTPYIGTSELVMQKIHKYVPGSKVFHLVRDGRDVLTSGAFDWLLKDAKGSERYRYFVDQQKRLVLHRFFDDDLIEHWATHWKETIDVRRLAGGADSLGVRYEDMKQDQAGELRRIFGQIGVDASRDVAEKCMEAVTFRKTTGRDSGDNQNPTAKARKGIQGDWKSYFTKQDGRLFNEVAGVQLIEMGYEPDPSWIDRLPESLSLEPAKPKRRSALQFWRS